MSCFHDYIQLHALLGEANTWYTNNGATEHMIEKKDWFSTMEQIKEIKHFIMVANDHSVLVKGRGNILVKRTVNRV